MRVAAPPSLHSLRRPPVGWIPRSSVLPRPVSTAAEVPTHVNRRMLHLKVGFLGVRSRIGYAVGQGRVLTTSGGTRKQQGRATLRIQASLRASSSRISQPLAGSGCHTREGVPPAACSCAAVCGRRGCATLSPSQQPRRTQLGPRVWGKPGGCISRSPSQQPRRLQLGHECVDLGVLQLDQLLQLANLRLQDLCVIVCGVRLCSCVLCVVCGVLASFRLPRCQSTQVTSDQITPGR